MVMEQLLERIRRTVTPAMPSLVPERFLTKLNLALQAKHINAQAVLGGSYAKGTYLPHDHDVDVFVRFAPSYTDGQMSDLLEGILSSWDAVARVHGSRDYFQLSWEGFSFEVVPVMRIAHPGEARNVTDASPLHVAYVLDHIRDRPSLAGDIRLAKLFCKAARVYGAESYLKGFSGHVLDLLVIHYGSFLALLEAAASWPLSLFIDPTLVHQDGSFLNPAKREGPLVLLDPLQEGRNAAAAVSEEKYALFKSAAAEFLTSPSETFFTPRVLSKEEVLSRHPGKPLLWYHAAPLPGSKDVAGTKLLKAHEHLVGEAEEVGFSVVEEGFWFDGVEARCFIVVEEEPLSPSVDRQGPPLAAERDALRFREVHGNFVYERDGRLFARLSRRYRTLVELFEDFSLSAYARERWRGAKII